MELLILPIGGVLYLTNSTVMNKLCMLFQDLHPTVEGGLKLLLEILYYIFVHNIDLRVLFTHPDFVHVLDATLNEDGLVKHIHTRLAKMALSRRCVNHWRNDSKRVKANAMMSSGSLTGRLRSGG